MAPCLYFSLLVESHKVLGACSLLSAVEILSYERGNLRLVGMITLMKDKEFTPATPGFRDPKHVGEFVLYNLLRDPHPLRQSWWPQETQIDPVTN